MANHQPFAGKFGKWFVNVDLPSYYTSNKNGQEKHIYSNTIYIERESERERIS